MTTYQIIGALPDNFDKRAHDIKLSFNGQEIANAHSIKLTSREVRFFGRKGFQLIKPA